MNPARADVEAYIRQLAIQYRLDPEQAIRQVQAESAFDQSAVSSTGAVGLFQLEPSTAKWLGIDPHEWKQNVSGGMHFLRILGIQLRTQPEVLAAFDWGQGNLSNLIAQYGPAWQAHLPKETADYIAKIFIATEPTA